MNAREKFLNQFHGYTHTILLCQEVVLILIPKKSAVPVLKFTLRRSARIQDYENYLHKQHLLEKFHKLNLRRKYGFFYQNT